MAGLDDIVAYEFIEKLRESGRLQGRVKPGYKITKKEAKTWLNRIRNLSNKYGYGIVEDYFKFMLRKGIRSSYMYRTEPDSMIDLSIPINELGLELILNVKIKYDGKSIYVYAQSPSDKIERVIELNNRNKELYYGIFVTRCLVRDNSSHYSCKYTIYEKLAIAPNSEDKYQRRIMPDCIRPCEDSKRFLTGLLFYAPANNKVHNYWTYIIIPSEVVRYYVYHKDEIEGKFKSFGKVGEMDYREIKEKKAMEEFGLEGFMERISKSLEK